MVGLGCLGSHLPKNFSDQRDGQLLELQPPSLRSSATWVLGLFAYFLPLSSVPSPGS